jgi:tetracycline 7-halogenase / FADH2 O2-dependent halogenase
MTADTPHTYDVAVLGTGLGGTLLGAVLARNGADVLLLDAGQHPKFAIGESTIPYTLVALRTMAERFDVPEITTLSSFDNCSRIIAPSFGVKKHFGFLLHEPGKKQDPKKVNQFNTPDLLNEASHLYRQDTDAYMLAAAIKYGCTARQRVRVVDVDVDDAGVTVHGAGGEEFRARYVVDAGGFRSPLAEKFQLREDPCRFKHHSRSMWNHMQGVTPTDQLFDHAPEDTPPVPWYEGTVHHMFDRGWFWVIGFDNHPRSLSSLCSVGLTLDPRKYPKDTSITPEEEFWRYAERYPDVARQFRGAKPMREWVSTDRLQYSSKKTVGDRWCLLSHAAGFIDPLFSRGLSNTAEAINALAPRLLRALHDGDFSAERFEFVDRLQQAMLDFNDELVNAAFISFKDYDLWGAVFRIWSWGSNAGTFRLQGALRKYRQDGREQHFTDLEEAPNLGLYWPDHANYGALFKDMVRRIDDVEAGRSTAADAADALYDQLQASDFVPKPFGFTDRNRRFIHPTPKMFASTAKWLVTEADPVVKQLMLGTGRQAVATRLRGRRIF